MNDLMLVLLVIFYVSLVVGVSLLLYYKKLIKGATARNLIHLLSGLSIISIFYSENKIYLLITSLLITIILFFSRKNTPVLKYLYKAIAEKDEKVFLQGPFLYGVSLTLLMLFSIITNNNLIPLASALVMIISDPFASFIGRNWGKHKVFLSYTGTVRTIEGSLAMLLSNILILSLLYTFNPLIIIISFFITIAELVSVSKWDDLVLPLVTLILLLLV